MFYQYLSVALVRLLIIMRRGGPREASYTVRLPRLPEWAGKCPCLIWLALALSADAPCSHNEGSRNRCLWMVSPGCQASSFNLFSAQPSVLDRDGVCFSKCQMLQRVLSREKSG